MATGTGTGDSDQSWSLLEAESGLNLIAGQVVRPTVLGRVQ